MKQKLNSTILVIVILATLMIGQPVSASSQYTIIDLGTLGGANSYPQAINQAGQVIGISSNAGEAEQHAFLWDSGEMRDLGTLAAGVHYQQPVRA